MGFPNSYAFIWDVKNVVSVTFNVLFPWPGKRTFLQMKDFEISPLRRSVYKNVTDMIFRHCTHWSILRKWTLFCNCYLAAPGPTLGHYRENSLTHPLLMTVF